MRVSFRRLCSTLEQFAPALNLPDAVDPQRIARIRRRLGLTRDLDVLRQRLDQQLLPQLPEREIRQLKPLLKQLKRERQLAFEDLVDTLQGRRYLKLLATLQQWLKQPVFTPLGEEPLAAWRPELVQAVLAGLTSLPGWWAASPYDSEAIAQLHRLRRRLKKARYGLSNLEPLDPQQFEPWVNRFRKLQDLLGDLNDLELIDAALHRQLDGEPDQLVPGLCSVMAERRSCSWQEWQGLAEPLRSAQTRLALNALSHA
jgi:CHAD domain-containing protein